MTVEVQCGGESPTHRWSSRPLWQLLLLIGVWSYLWILHGNNDGLWFQGDSPRHAINSFFWIDYLRDFTWDAKRYALGYYARYPAIDPASRPPVFYILTGAAFQIFGPSPYVAKGLVLCFSLLGSVYLWAWLRRWISAQAGWAAGLFLLVPGTMLWSHAVMLNMPALALGVAGLYHARCWLQSPDRRTRDFLIAAVLSLLGILVYYPTGVVIFVIAVWMVVIPVNWKHWMKTSTLLVIGGCLLILLPFVWLITGWASLQLEWVLPTTSTITSLSTWTYYPSRILKIFNAYLLCLAGVGVVVGFVKHRWRRETLILTSWIGVLYLVFTLLFAKDVRYALPVVPPLICLCVIAVQGLCEAVTGRSRLPFSIAPRLVVGVLWTLLLFQAAVASLYEIPVIRGYRELTSFIKQVAPEGAVFYDGDYDGLFTFYVRAGDPQFHQRVVVGNKLLYASAMTLGWRLQSFVDSPDDVIELLQRRGGCRWLAIEVTFEEPTLLPMRHLRDAIKTPAFELVASFPIESSKVERVDVYKFLLPLDDVQEVDLPFPRLGPDVGYRVQPIPTRTSQ